jgi:hypothetical protein
MTFIALSADPPIMFVFDVFPGATRFGSAFSAGDGEVGLKKVSNPMASSDDDHSEAFHDAPSIVGPDREFPLICDFS